MSHKKRNVDENEHFEEDSESSDGENPDIYQGKEEILVDFEGRNPIDTDFHGIKQLLHQLFLKAHINTTELTDIIIAQNYIGSVIKQCDIDDEEEDEDIDMEEPGGTVFGITTAVNITNKEQECIKQFRSFIIEKAEKNATDAALKLFKDVLGNDGRPTGLLLNERFINIPAPIAVPLLDNLRNEVRRANDKKMPYNFSYYIMLIKYFQKDAAKKRVAETFYTNPEEELFSKECLASFDYSVEVEAGTGLSGNWLEEDAELKPFRKVVVFDAKKLPDIVNMITEYIKQ